MTHSVFGQGRSARPAPDRRPQVPLVIRRAEILSSGLSDNDIRRARERGEIAAVAPGVYLRADDLRGLDGAARHRVVVAALVPHLTGDPVVSHSSAAILHGLTCANLEPAAVHVSRSGSVKSRRGAAVQVHRAAILTADEVVLLDGIAVTSVARTVVDCASTMPFDASLQLATDALRRALVTGPDLAAQLGRHARVPGSRRAAAVLAAAADQCSALDRSLD